AFGVERGHLAVAASPIEADGLGECAVGFQTDDGGTGLARAILERPQQARAEADTGSRGRDPHPLQFRGGFAMQLYRAARDRLLAQTCDEEKPMRRPELAVV